MADPFNTITLLVERKDGRIILCSEDADVSLQMDHRLAYHVGLTLIRKAEEVEQEILQTVERLTELG
jgi:hypothetical protein